MTATASPQHSQWVRVTRRHPCPICGRPDWCRVTADGRLAHCMRTTSDWPSKCRLGGHIHRLDGQEGRPAPQPRRKAEPVRPRLSPAQVLHYLNGLRTTDGELRSFADTLGVSQEALQRLGAARDHMRRAWAFPMRHVAGLPVGIRLRYDNGRKRSLRGGSGHGLFIPSGLPRAGRLYVAEGPTDTAALLTVGVAAIGRSACMGQEGMVAVLAEGRQLAILADRDEAKTRPDGSVWYPGQEGAEALARFCLRWTNGMKILYPPDGFKDARAALNAGKLSPDALEALWSAAMVVRPGGA